MSDRIFSCDFEIQGQLPKELFAKFMELQAKLLGLRGWIQQTADNIYKGQLQGQMPNMDNYKKVLEQAEQFKAIIEKAAFAEFKEIQKFTTEKFEVRLQ